MEPLALPLDDADAAELADTVSIELNFKAFADNVPTSQHAKRKSTRDDPSIQDFADQVLELAALRAELKRLARDYEILQQQAMMRDARLEALSNELMATRLQLRETRRQVPEEVRGEEATVSLEASPPVPHLIPIDQLDPPVALSREIVTIGRTRNSDICIPSRGVSRDHARLLIAPGRVTLVDVSTTNGCFVNGVLVSRHRLRDGDLVRIGDRSFRFALNHGGVAKSSPSRALLSSDDGAATTGMSLGDLTGDRGS